MNMMQQPTALSLAQQPTPQADYDRKNAMREAWKAYRGAFPRPLKVKSNAADDNVISNRCAPIVDKGVSFLFGQVVKIEATKETTQPATVIQDALDDLWGDDDDKMTLLTKIAVNGGVCGQPFVKLIPQPDRGGKKQPPRLIVLDPQLIRVVTPADDCDLVLAYIIEYPGGDDLQKKQIIARIDPDGMAEVTNADDLDETWTITNYERRGMAGSWYQVGDAVEWPYVFAPIFSNQNLPNPNEFWGVPDLTQDLIDQNKVLNFVQSNISRIIKFHAHPKTWVKGVGMAQISTNVDEVLVLESDTAQIGNLEMHSNLNDSQTFASVIRSDMDEQSRIPGVALGRLESLPKGSISGVALQLLFQPILEKTVTKQRLYGRLIRDISRAALVLMELISMEEYETYQIDLHFQNLLPVDDLQAAQAAQILLDIGVSEETVLSELGYNAQDEAKKSAKEAQKKLALMPPPPSVQQQDDTQQQQQTPQSGQNAQQPQGVAA